jgi:cell division septation protein DedD
MIKKKSFRFSWIRDLIVIDKNISGGCLIFALLVCMSCTTLNTSTHDDQTAKALAEPAKHGLSLPPECRPLSENVYVVQAGAFKHIAYAQALRNTLEKNGYEGYITVSGFDEDKRIFRVLIGQFNDMRHAQGLSEEIKKKMNLDVIVELKPPKDKFVVQAGCFKEMSEARALRQKLADNGHNAYITFSGTGGNKQYNVLLGEFLNQAEAEKVTEEIRKKEIIQVFVNIL